MSTMEDKAITATAIDEKHIEHGGAFRKLSVTAQEEQSLGGLRTVEGGLTAEQVIDTVEKDAAERRRILRKVDWHLVPLLTFLYLVAFVDRSNIGNAKIAGLNDDLHLHGLQYNVALTVFFPPYALLEVPSNIVLKLIRPSIWISILLFSWGLVMTLMGLVDSYKGLVIARFFLGVAECGFFPAATYLLTLWYLRYEVMRRMAIFYAAASLAGAFSGLLAFGIQHMEGVGGRHGWQWIFILEGLVPIAMSFVLYFILPDNPESARFLTKSEKEFIINRLALETGSGHGRVTNTDRIRFHHIKAAFSEWKIWAGVVIFWANTIGTYGFTATVPTIVEALGYTSAKAQLMTIPIYIFAVIMVLIFAFWSDRIQQRTPFIMAGFIIAVIGLIGMLITRRYEHIPGVSYFFLFLVAGGFYSPFVPLVCLVANNLAPSSKRAVGMAVLISFGNLGGICGSNIYLAKEAPRYPAGFGTGIGICTVAVGLAYLLRVAYRKENDKRDTLMSQKSDEEIRAQYTEEELLNMGDRSPFFRYTV